MKYGKRLVPKRRFRKFENSGEWERKKLGEIVEINMGQSPDSENYTNNPNDYILVQGNADIKNGRVLPRVWTTQVTKLATKNDLILSVRAPAGDVGRTDYDVVLGRGVAGIKGNEFIFQLLTRMKENEHWRKLSTGSTFESINSNDIKESYVLITNDGEQKVIGAFFNNLDNLITIQKQKLKKVKDLKSAYLSDMFPKEEKNYPKIRFTGFNEPWEQCELGKLGNTFTGLSGKTKDDFGHGNAEFVTYMNVFSNPLAKTSQTENVEIDDSQNEIKFGDIFFTTSSETPEEVGMSSVWLGGRANVYLNSFCFGYRPMSNLDSYYMAYMLRSPEVRKQFIFLAQGISRYNISKIKVMRLSVPIPKNEEQIKIGKFFENLDNLITLDQRKLEKLQNIKKAYLNEMFV